MIAGVIHGYTWLYYDILPYYTTIWLELSEFMGHMQLSRHIGSWFSPGVAHDHPAAPRWWMRRWGSACVVQAVRNICCFADMLLIWNSWRLQLECGREGHPQAPEGLLPSGSVGRLPGFAPKNRLIQWLLIDFLIRPRRSASSSALSRWALLGSWWAIWVICLRYRFLFFNQMGLSRNGNWKLNLWHF